MDQQILVIGNFCQAATVVLSLCGYIPQWRVVLKTRRSDGLSLHTFALWIASTILALSYSVVQYRVSPTSQMLLYTNLANLTFLIATVIIILAFRTPSAPAVARFSAAGSESLEDANLGEWHNQPIRQQQQQQSAFTRISSDI